MRSHRNGTLEIEKRREKLTSGGACTGVADAISDSVAVRRLSGPDPHRQSTV